MRPGPNAKSYEDWGQELRPNVFKVEFQATIPSFRERSWNSPIEF